MDNNSAKHWIRNVAKVATLPDICLRINDIAANPLSTAVDIGRAIGQDPAFTAHVLKIANSSYYSTNAKIETLSRAVVMLGIQQLRYLAVSICSVDALGKFNLQIENLRNYWKHSLLTAICSRALALKLHILNSERLFVIGLLHDIGKLVFQHVAPVDYRQASLGASQESVPLYQREKATFGFDHAELGAELLTQWRLPAAICDAVRFHHDLESAGTVRMEAALAHLGDAIAWRIQSSQEAVVVPDIHPSAWVISHLNERIIDGIVVLAEKQYAELSEVYNSIAPEYVARQLGGAA